MYSRDRTLNCSAGERSPPARAAGDLVLYDGEVVARQRVDMPLEGERPVFGRPLSHVVEPVCELLGRNPVRILEDRVRPDVDSPWVVLVSAGRTPDRGVVLVHRRCNGDCCREGHPARHVVEDAIADAHRFDSPPVAALETLDREAQLTGLAEVVR